MIAIYIYACGQGLAYWRIGHFGNLCPREATNCQKRVKFNYSQTRGSRPLCQCHQTILRYKTSLPPSLHTQVSFPAFRKICMKVGPVTVIPTIIEKLTMTSLVMTFLLFFISNCRKCLVRGNPHSPIETGFLFFCPSIPLRTTSAHHCSSMSMCVAHHSPATAEFQYIPLCRVSASTAKVPPA